MYTNENECRVAGKVFAAASLIYNTEEDLIILLEDCGMSVKEVVSYLSRENDITLARLSDICYDVGIRPSITFKRE